MNRSRLLTAAVVVVVAVVGISFILRMGDGTTVEKKEPRPEAEAPLAKARAILDKGHDVSACHAALQQFSILVFPKPVPSPTPAEEKLRGLLALDQGELEEIGGKRYTRLDGHHLDLCFLLRDAALSLELEPRGGKDLPAVKRAAAAFAWAIRHVRSLPGQAEAGDPLPPQFTLRLGLGGPNDRALVFLGLLDQLGIDGCLLALPGGGGRLPRYWACGALAPDGQIYLFDPRLGMPLPSADGKGVATLAEVQQKDSPALARLRLDKDNAYDVTPEQAAASEVHVVVYLSALAPRMKFLEGEFFSPSTKARVAADAGVIERFEKALKTAGREKAEVKAATWTARLQRQFLPETEGGLDKPHPATRMTTRDQVTNFMAEANFILLLQELEKVPEAVNGNWSNPPRSGLTKVFYQRVTDFFFTPNKPRDRVLRGHYANLSRELAPLQDRMKDAREALRVTFDPKQVGRWVEEAGAATAELSRDPNSGEARRAFEEVGRRYGKQLELLVEGSIAKVLVPEAAFLLAVSKHEQAERFAFRLDVFPDQATPATLANTKSQWESARRLWIEFLDQHGTVPEKNGQPLEYPMTQVRAARILLARSLEVLGDLADAEKKREEARKGWESAMDAWRSAASDFKGLPALACRYRAKQLQDRLDAMK